MRRIQLLPTLVVLCVAAQSVLLAQRPTHDPRPLKGRPSVASAPMRTLLDQRHPGGLLDHAVRLGGGSWQPLAHSEVPDSLRRMLDRTSDGTSVPHDVSLRRAGNGTIDWMSGRLGRVDMNPEKRVLTLATAATRSLDAVASYFPLLGLHSPRTELEPIAMHIDALGMRHVRYRQVFDGIPVWGRDLWVHTDADGTAYLLNGCYEPTPSGVATSAAISGDGAIGIVIDDLQARRRWAPITGQAARVLDVDPPKAALVLYPVPDTRTMRLAWDVELQANLLESFTYLIDARTGTVLDRINRSCAVDAKRAEADPPPATAVQWAGPTDDSPMSAGTFQDASGVDLNGQTRQFRTYHHTDNTFYEIWDLPNLDAARSTLPNTVFGGSMVVDSKNHDLQLDAPLVIVASASNSWSDPASISAHVNQKTAYDYYSSTFGRHAIDDKDQLMISVIHVTQGGQPMDNAYWSGREMAYGDGATEFKPLAGAMDVSGHEMTHGVVQSTADLIYQNQSGALNESFADVFGAMMDREDYLMGEDIVRPGKGIALRDLLHPDNPQVLSQQPAHMNQYVNLGLDQDNGGVHVNSGIPNRAAALLMEAIGHDKVEQIYYRALSTYLVRDSKFIDCRRAVIQAATDLYGDGAEVAAARTAFDQVGILDGPGTDPGNNDVPPLSGGQTHIAFIDANGQIGLLDPFTGNAVFDPSPDAQVRVSQIAANDFDRAQVTTARNGSKIWFIGTDGTLRYADVATGDVFGFPDLMIQQQGDLWNCSIAPDESAVALVSAYENDATLYFSDGVSLFAIALKPESTQDGIDIETILYPDVVNWSPNASLPRVSFDALNEINVNGQPWQYWSIFEIDFSSERIYNLIPAQPQDISVGNITYSKVDPDVVAFNVVDPQGVFDVAIADFAHGTLSTLDMPHQDLGVPVLDAQRPTFSPDNQYMAMTTPSNDAMLFLDGTTGGFSALTFPDLPMYNPHWFVTGGVVSVGSAMATSTAAARLTEVWPNPVSATAEIGFELPAPSRVRIDLVDLFGRRVAQVLDAVRDAGVGSARVDTRSLPAGSYLVRMRVGDRTQVRPLIVVR